MVHELTSIDQVFLSVVIPVYNELDTIQTVIERVKAAPLKKEIIIVDDGSIDGTREYLKSVKAENVHVYFHDQNKGKGAALSTGFSRCKGNLVVIQDADLEYDPAEYSKLIQPVIDADADVVYGSRFRGQEAHRVHYFWHYVGNKFITLLSNMFTNLNLTDIESCYKLFKADIIHKLNVCSRGFSVEVEMTCKIAKMQCKVFEVGISYAGRSYADGKKISWLDGIKAVLAIIRFSWFT